MAMDQQSAFRDQRGLARICRGFLLAQALLAAIGALFGWWTWQLLDRVAAGALVDSAAATADDARTLQITLLQMLLYIVGGIATLVWIYRANRNAHLIGTLEMEMTPGWAAGWYFIPFLNLFMPLRAMREIWAASASAAPDAPAPQAILIGPWWAAWIGTNLTGLIAIRIASDAESPEMLRASAGFDIASNLIMIAACLLLAGIVARIQDIQNRAAPTEQSID
jgi:hypothetical protein